MMTRALGAALRLMFLIVKMMISLPFLAVRSLRRVIALGRGALLLVGQDDVRCRDCGATLVLTARWRCQRCGYVWLGFGFSRCPLCDEPCLFLNCSACGTSIRNPLP